MKITMIEPIAVSEDLLNALAKSIRDKGHEVQLCTAPLSPEEKQSRIKGADAIIIANSPLPAEWVENAPNLKMISVAFTGIDHVPGDACKSKNVLVSNAQGYATIAVRDLVFGLIFACMRNMKPCDLVVREGGTKDGLVGDEIDGKVLGIVGYGAIGQAVAYVAKAFGCEVLAYSRSKKPGSSDGTANFVSFDDVLAKSDIISLHTPLTGETKHMIGHDELKKMKQTAILINTARGPVVDSKALAEALNAGTIAAAGIDVFDIEPPLNMDEPLLSAKNAVLMPHIGFATKQSMVKRAHIVFDNVIGWLDGKPQNVKI